jgi:hypothetical protein
VLVGPDGDGAVVRISNSTEGLDDARLAHGAERIAPIERAPDGPARAGLGLSIVRAACAKLGHRFTVRLERGTFYATIARSGARVPIAG